MHKIVLFFFALALMLVYSCGNQSGNATTGLHDADTGTAVMIFREYEHDFGKVAEGETVAYVFAFENKGTSDLVISSVTTTCGCTVPKYETKPIPPGKNGTIEVAFNTSARSGMQTKTITVKSNASIPVILVRITAEVEDKLN
jgi:hypothetical protein